MIITQKQLNKIIYELDRIKNKALQYALLELGYENMKNAPIQPITGE